MRPLLAGLLAMTLASPAGAAPLDPPDPVQAHPRGEGRVGPIQTTDPQTIVPGSRRHTESYGPSAAHTFDVYSPPDARGARRS